VKFLFKAMKLASLEKPDAIIGYNTLGFVAAFIASNISPTSKLIYHNFDFDTSTDGLGVLGRLLKRVELFAARRSTMTIFPSPERASKYKAVARLEERLGARLFVRTTRSLGLTEDGQMFYERCAQALARGHELYILTSCQPLSFAKPDKCLAK
jgi:hypothetical protein